MFKILLFISIALICSIQANAQLLSGCATAHGNLVHKVSKVEDKFIGLITFPSFRDFKIDPSGQTRVLNAPLTNDPVFSDRLDFLNAENTFLSKIFGDSLSLNIQFDSCELQQSADQKLNARFCVKHGPLEINGEKISRIEFSLQNQFRQFLVGNAGETGETEAVYADLIFTTVANNLGKIFIYKSSYTYYPDGNSTQCSLSSSSYIQKDKALNSLKQ